MMAARRLLLGLVAAAGMAHGATAETLAEAAAKRFPQPVRVGDLISRQVLRPLESQPRIGRVTAVVSRPDGMVEIVMEYGGLLGFFARPIAVPVEAMALLGQYLVVMGFSPQQLDALPDFAGTGTTPLAPDAVIRVALTKPAH